MRVMLEWARRLWVRAEPASTSIAQTRRGAEDENRAAAEASYREGDEASSRDEWERAASAYAAALELRHDWGQAHHRLGVCMHRLGRYEEACDCFELAWHFGARDPRVHLDRAYAQRKLGAREAALASVRAMTASDRATVEACNLEGALLLDAGDVAGAVAAFERAVALAPDDAHANSNLGYVLFRDCAQYERGARHIERALAIDPDDLGHLCNYTMVLAHRGELERMIALCDRILERAPHLDEVRLNRGLGLLKLGRFEVAWGDYEARKRVRSNFRPRELPWPEWRGEALAGKTLLIHGEQGLGDELMFASCFADMIERASHCVLECEPRLERLFRRSFPRATVVAGEQTRARPSWLESGVPPIDFQIAAGSLPLHLRDGAERFPAHAGYIAPDPRLALRWRGRLNELGAGLKVGISWRGGLASTRRDLRSMELSTLLPLFELPGLNFIDLQYGDTREERARLQAEQGEVLHTWPQAAGDLDELAALVSELDLVVSVCTAVIHLGGALGREVWVLVPSVPEWRYQQHGTRMPWYPSVRLFRQPAGEGWTRVVGEVADRLRERAAGSAIR